jgi:hypothetical protein
MLGSLSSGALGRKRCRREKEKDGDSNKKHDVWLGGSRRNLVDLH